MLEQALLREQVQALLASERQAEAAYADLASKVEDPAVKQQIQALRHDKQRHIRLAERLLEILD
jgi:rubrerythrin